MTGTAAGTIGAIGAAGKTGAGKTGAGTTLGTGAMGRGAATAWTAGTASAL